MQQFFEWTEGIAAELSAKAPASDIFQRFAGPIPTLSGPNPANILLDIDELTEEFVDGNNQIVEFDIDHVCVDVVEDLSGPIGYRHQFDLVIGGVPRRIWIKWDHKKGSTG